MFKKRSNHACRKIDKGRLDKKLSFFCTLDRGLEYNKIFDYIELYSTLENKLTYMSFISYAKVGSMRAII
jgi:hypothetical protein